LGASLSAAAFGAILGLMGSLLGLGAGRAEMLTIAVLAVVYAMGLLPGVHVPVPQLRRQVPDWWRTFFSPPTTAFLYGAGLGVGFLTFLPSGVLVVVSVAALASASPALGAALLLPFGLARGMSAVVSANVYTPDEASRLVQALVDRPDAVRRAGSALSLVAVATLAAWLSRDLTGGWSLVATSIFAGVFAWAGIAKLAGRRRWRRTLSRHALPADMEGLATWAVPAAELAVPVLAALGYRSASGVWAILLLTGFSAEVVRMRLRIGRTVPCGCFGGRREVGAAALLLRNALLGAAALVALGASSEPLVRWPGPPTGAETLPFLLATGGLVTALLATWRASIWLGRGRT
jgi:hypothetical protein